MKTIIRLLLLLITFGPMHTMAADYYWIGGSGDWSDINHWATSSGGTLLHIQTPTAADNVIFDQNSMNADAIINLNLATIFSHDINTQQITHELKLSGLCTLWKVYGSLKLNSKLELSASPHLYFEAATGVQTINTGKLALYNKIYFKGTASWQIEDTLVCGDIYLESGTLITNSRPITCNSMHSNSPNARSLQLGNSVINTGVWEVIGSGYTVNAGNSKIIIRNGQFKHTTNTACNYNDVHFIRRDATLVTANYTNTFRKVIFDLSGGIQGDHTYDSLVLSKGRTYNLSPTSTQTIIKDLIANGDCRKYINIKSAQSFASISKSNGTIQCEYVTLHHVHGIGGANFQAMAVNDLGDNVGWNMFPAPSRDLYWVAGSGSWKDTAHWSASSGGPAGECIPTLVDNVFIDGNSPRLFPLEVFIDSTSNCHNITWSNTLPGTIEQMAIWNIAGSMYLGPQVEMVNPGIIYFVSKQQGEEIQTSNINLKNQYLEFRGTGGWLLLDSIKNIDGSVVHVKGTLNTNSQHIESKEFSLSSQYPKTTILGNSIINIWNKCIIQQDSLTVIPGHSHIHIKGNNAFFKSLGPNPDTFYNLSFENDSGQTNFESKNTRFNKVQMKGNSFLTGIATSDTLYFEKNKSFVFEGERSDTINKALIAMGNCYEPIGMREVTSMGNFYFILAPNASYQVSHLRVRGSDVTRGRSINTNNCNDLGNNPGWTFTVPTNSNLYWVNGQGNWQDSAHWSYSSGGSGGACIPQIFDNVFFDVNSFTGIGDSVLVDTANIYCKNMNWTGASGNPIFYDSSRFVHFISGSMTLIPSVKYKMYNETHWVWTQRNKHIDMAGNIFYGNILFCDTGQWILHDTLIVKNNIYHHSGAVESAQFPIDCYNYYGEYNFPKTLNIQHSTFTLLEDAFFNNFTWIQSPNTNLISNNSSVVFESQGKLRTIGTGQTTFDHLYFNDSILESKIEHGITNTNRFEYLKFKGNGNIEGDNYMDTLIFSKGKRYILQGNRNQYITNYWHAKADCYGYISINGAGSTNVHQLNGNVNHTGVLLENINGIGSGSFTIIDGDDLGGNSPNWQITSMPSRRLYWVNTGGKWHDTTHWSLSSGGPGGECIPTKIDDVIFDINSFIPTDDSVVSPLDVDFHNMFWSYTPDTPVLSISNLNIYGSLWFGDTLNTRALRKTNFKANDQGNTIRTANKQIPEVNLNGNGEWKLLDQLNCNHLVHYSGELNSNRQSINLEYYSSIWPKKRKLIIANSEMMVKYEMNILTDSFTLDANQSHIRFNHFSPPQFLMEFSGTKPLQFDKVSFEPVRRGSTIIRNLSPSIHHFNELTMNNSGDFYGTYDFDSLIFHFGNTYQLESGKTQNINDHWLVRGNNCFALILQSTTKNSQAYVNKNMGTVNGDFIGMRDIHATGGAQFYAGNFSTDISNNQGWTFANGPQYVYGLGRDTSFALGSSIVLNTTNFNGGPNTTYLWSDGSTQPTLNVNTTGWYHITVTYAGNCIVYDSIWVGCDLNIQYTINHNPCFGDSLGSITIHFPDTNYFYSVLWSTNETSDSIWNLKSDTFTLILSADSGLCQLNDTVTITSPPQIHITQGDTAFCEGDSILLDLGSYQQFVWHDGQSGQYRWVKEPDSLQAKVQNTDGCWSEMETIHLRMDQPPSIQLGNDTTICYGESIDLDAGAGFDDYLWSTFSNMSSINILHTGIYWVAVYEKTCVVVDSIEVFNCPPVFNVPNVFTPNGDGFNDELEIEYQNIFKYEIKIYNRWGVRVFESEDLNNPWNGKIKGMDAVEGVYFWEIIYQEYNGQGGGNVTKGLKGTVSLYR